MIIKKRILQAYVTVDGGSPFKEWLESLQKAMRMRVQSRLERVALGNFGDFKPLQDGIYELRIHTHGGYRIYYDFDEDKIVILLYGGIKRSQRKDVDRAKEYWQDYLARKKKNVH